MARKFTLYWSSFQMYEQCPQKFLWGRGWGDIDVGGGPGRRKPVPVRKSDHHRLMGMVIQDVIERFYKDELWRNPKGLRQRLSDMVDKQFTLHFDNPKWYVPFGQRDTFGMVPDRGELMETCRAGVLGYLPTMKYNKLLGTKNLAEYDMLAYINKYNPIGGRCDLLVERDDTGITIVDGKNSQSKDKYTDPDQLRWYALAFYLCFGKLPNRLGFVYYRYPYDEATGEAGVSWIECTKSDIQGLARRAVDARRGMDREQFEPTPSPDVCKLCDYEEICTARQEQKAANSRGRRKPKAIEVQLSDATGVVEFGFDNE